VGVGANNVEGLPADRPGGAQHGDASRRGTHFVFQYTEVAPGRPDYISR
jgi:hypothetical protein